MTTLTTKPAYIVFCLEPARNSLRNISLDTTRDFSFIILFFG